MKKIIATLIATFFCFITAATSVMAYDSPTFPEAKKEWKYFNPETVRFFNFNDEDSPCPYEKQIHVSDLIYNDTTVSVYAYFDSVTGSEGTWLCDGLGHSIDVVGKSYEGYLLFEASTGICITLTENSYVTATADGMKVTISETSSKFEECPYDTATLISEETFTQRDVDGIPVRVFSYTYDSEPGVWLTDAYGNTADFRGAKYNYNLSSQASIQLLDGNVTINVSPSTTGFHTQIGSTKYLIK